MDSTPVQDDPSSSVARDYAARTGLSAERISLIHAVDSAGVRVIVGPYNALSAGVGAVAVTVNCVDQGALFTHRAWRGRADASEVSIFRKTDLQRTLRGCGTGGERLRLQMPTDARFVGRDGRSAQVPACVTLIRGQDVDALTN